MICEKCGNEFAEGKFCPECGTKYEKKEETPSGVQKDTKPKKMLLMLGAVILFLIIGIFVAANWEGKTDYLATVKEHRPFAVSQGLPYTYEEVLNKYLESPEWKVRKEGEVHYVDISGAVKGTDSKLIITMKLSSNPADPDGVLIKPVSAVLDERQSSSEEEAVNVLYNLFSLYDEGYEELSLADAELTENDGDMEETARQILLEWFDRHPLKHDIRIRFMNEAVNAGRGGERYLVYEVDTIWGEYGTLYVNPTDGDMIMEAITDGTGNWVSIHVSIDQWYLEYYWGLTEDSGYYFEYYADDIYEVYDEMENLILEYNAERDSYTICNFDGYCFVEYDDGTNTSDSEVNIRDFVGTYSYDASYETESGLANFYYSLQIDWEENIFVITEEWRGNVVIEAWARPDSLVGNTLTFELPSIDGMDYDNHVLTYVPAEDSPLGKDVIYIDGDDTMPFVRE